MLKLSPAPVLAALACFLFASAVRAAPEVEDTTIKTADGLKLACKWYRGEEGKRSACVMMLHNYGKDFSSTTKGGEYESLAKTLQKEGFSVLMFDLRGHGKNKNVAKSMGDGKKFSEQKYNTYSGAHLNPDNPPKSIDAGKFTASYYPFLLNDIAAARKFLDEHNDAGECNSGRIFIIADREMCPLAFYWALIEFDRNGKYAPAPFLCPPVHDAGSDIMGIVCLSYRNHGAWEIPYTKVTTGRTKIHNNMRDKVSVLFLESENGPGAGQGAAKWFGTWGIQAGKKEDKEKGKYITVVEKSEKLTGVDLLAANKALKVDDTIVQFLKSTNKKNINGNDWQERNASKAEIVPVPLQDYGIRVP